MVPRCDNCRERPALVYQMHTKRRLCKACFLEDVKARILREIQHYKMIEPQDRVLVGVSGGKDSLTLLDILAQIHDTSKIVALTIIEGIQGYNRDLELEEVRKLTKKHGIDLIIVSIKEVLGYSVDEFVEAQKKLRVKYPLSACTYCGIARRRILNHFARELGTNKVATGHLLDDEVQTYIINILRGDIVRLVQLHPLSEVRSPKLVKRVKPLRKIYEYETTMYAYINGFRFQESECPYISSRPTLRAKIRSMLIEIENLNPGTQLKLLELFDRVLEPLVEEYRRSKIKLSHCIRCGEPTSPTRNICKFCELIDMIREAQKRAY